MVEKDRADRLAAALRDNLKRRKAQARAKLSSPGDAPPPGGAAKVDTASERPAETAVKKPKNR